MVALEWRAHATKKKSTDQRVRFKRVLDGDVEPFTNCDVVAITFV